MYLPIASTLFLTSLLAASARAGGPVAQGRVAGPVPVYSETKLPFVGPPKSAPANVEVRVAPAGAPAPVAKSERADVPARLVPPPRTHVLHDVDVAGKLWTRGSTYKASFGAEGATYVPCFGSQAPRNFPLQLEIQSVSVGGELLTFERGVQPLRSADQIVYDRGTLREVYDTSLQSLEQSFVFESLPARGEIVVRVRATSELARAQSANRLSFANQHGSIEVSDAVAFDAAGRRTELPMRLVGDAIEISVPADVVANATLPLVVDPVFWSGTVHAGALETFNPDVAFDSSTTNTIYVMEEIYSATDHDILFEVRDSSGGYVSVDYVDYTTTFWARPQVASQNGFDQFYVAAVAGDAPNREIGGRMVSATGAMGAVAFLSTDAFGDQEWCDVGGDYYDGSPSFVCVVWQRDFAANDTDILVRLVEPSGAPIGDINYLSNSGGTLDRHPSVSRGTGSGWNVFQGWNIAFDHQVGDSDRDIWGAQLQWNGPIVNAPFPIETSSFDDAYPSASTCMRQFEGNDPYMVAYQRYYNALDHDIVADVLTSNVKLASANLTIVEQDFVLHDQIAASVDTDGGMFHVAYMESYGQQDSSDFDIYVSQFALTNGLIVASEPHQNMAFSATTENWPQLATQYSAGGSGTCSITTWQDQNGPTYIEGANYCGRIGGAVTTFCFGDGSAGACPCFPGTAGRGCPNSFDFGGAELAATGNASVFQDSLTLIGSHMPTTTTCLYYQGTTGAGGTLFGDGLRCAAGTVIRLGTKANVGGTSQYPSGSDAPVSVRGNVPPSGATRTYQCWYRNLAVFCTSATFNLTNGVRVQWTP
jgi:hypothetical protein